MHTSVDFSARCLPGDVEVLTEAGWRRGTELRDGERVAVWDPADHDVTIEPALGVTTGRYAGSIISIHGAAASTTGNPDRGVWMRTPLAAGDTWSHWHVRPLADLDGVTAARVPVSGHRSGPGLRADAGDYAGVLGWISVEDGYYGTGLQIRPTESNLHRAVATASRLTALGAQLKCTPGRGGITVQAWFLPGPLTAKVRGDLSRDLVSWPAVWKMNSVELHAFVDGAVGGRRRTLYRLTPSTVDLMQAVGALTGHRTTAHDVGRRSGGTLDMGIGLDAPLSRSAIKRRVDTWDGPAFALDTRTGAVIARRNHRVFVAAT